MSDLQTGPISWTECAMICDEYKDVMRTEFMDHNLEVDDHGVIRWVANPKEEQKIMNFFGASDLNDLFGRCNVSKNDPIIRKLYKHIGYSLFGFWEVFYWEVNNERASEYNGRKTKHV